MHEGKQYMFKKAPFGLKPLSSLFQRGMPRILGDLPFVLNFIDDIVIFSKNREEHAAHVKCVIERLNAAKLIINRSKCNFFSTQISLLGFIVHLKGKGIDPSKLVNIHEWDAPTTAKQVQSYLGTFNFFREHIPLYSTIAAPLDALRHREGTFKLNKDEIDSFNGLKELLARAPLLSFPDFSRPFYVATDASNVGIGAVLYQLPEGVPEPKDMQSVLANANYISFMARTLQDRERKYSATKKELLAIVFALKKFHSYLWGRHFTLFTDHRALTFLHSQKELNPMMTTWFETILEYTFTVVYRPGVLNVLPDALSRQFPQKLWTDCPKQNTPFKVYGYIHMLNDKSVPRFTVAASDRRSLMAEVHSLGHFGANKMVDQIHAQNKTWPLMAKDCLEYVKQCPECQRINITRKGYHPLKAINVHLPGEHMTVDLAGEFPLSSKNNKYLLVLTDVCTRFVILKAIPDKTAATVATTLFDTFSLIGFPRVLQSDNGREFSNQVTKIMTEQMGIHHRLVTPYHPRGNGLAENRVKAVKEILRKEIKGKKHEWDRHVPMAQFAMNANVATLHGSSPFSLFFARKVNGHYNYTDDHNNVMSQDDLLKRLDYMTTIVFPAIEAKTKSTQQKMIERFNRTILHCEFPDGSKVMAVDPIKGDSLSPRYEGPYTVVRKNRGGAYCNSQRWIEGIERGIEGRSSWD